MSNPIIRVEGLGKEFRIGGRQEAYQTLRDTLTDAFMGPVRRARSLLRGEAYGAAGLKETIWALRDVSFDVEQGEVMGIIGRNGAGKSTLLKVLSRITEPTEGWADLFGRVRALLEVGTGFHQELTGRENIYLNGAILGMIRTEITQKFDEIVAFAEVEKFIDTPVKYYSSGMGLRLGFAVAAHLEPEILVVDEVLAVGDVAFQKKCLGKMEDMSQSGRTVLFVSHNMGAVQNLCTRSVWLDGGRVRMIGDTEAVVAEYLSAMSKGELALQRDAPLHVTHVVLKNTHGQKTNTFHPGDDIIVDIHYHTIKPYIHPSFFIKISSRFGPVCAANMVIDGQRPAVIEGRGMITCRFKAVPLLPQTYNMAVGAFGNNRQKILREQEVGVFHIHGNLSNYGLVGEHADTVAPMSVPIMIPYEWQYADGSIKSVEIRQR